MMLANWPSNEIRTNMENCLVNLKHRWSNSTIAISGLTFVPRDNSKTQLIDEINCHYESICTDLGVTFEFIANKRVTCDNCGNLISKYWVFLQVPESIVFCSLGITLYLAFFCVLSFVSFVLHHLCSGSCRRSPSIPRWRSPEPQNRYK